MVKIYFEDEKELWANCRAFCICFCPGAIFEQGTTEVQTAFKYALVLHNAEASRFELQSFVDVINTADAFKLSRISKFAQYLLYNITVAVSMPILPFPVFGSLLRQLSSSKFCQQWVSFALSETTASFLRCSQSSEVVTMLHSER